MSALALKPWTPKNVLDVFSLPVSWREVVGILSLSLVGNMLWQQYGVLRCSNRPTTDLGLPIVGHTFSIFRESFVGFMGRLIKGKKAVLTNLFGSNLVVVDWRLYMEHLHRLEVDGQMVSEFPASLHKTLGPNSVLFLRGGKGHVKHKHLRNKILSCLAPKSVLALVPDITHHIRQMLDKMVEETASKGFTCFHSHASALAADISSLPITAGLDPKLQEQVSGLLAEVLDGIMSVPIDLGRFTLFGRAMAARRQLEGILKDIVASPNLSRRSIISDLVQASEDGRGFTLDEMVDTAVTLLVAGKHTTSETMTALMAHLHRYRDWVQRIAQEPLHFVECEGDSATLRFIRETMRVQAPVGHVQRRLADRSEPIDLGEHGMIPPGTGFAVFLVSGLGSIGDRPDSFDPERWTAEVVRNYHHISFGGPQPHLCLGKTFALMELQVFTRILCAEYEFETGSQDLVVQEPFLTTSYKDGLKVKISRKKA